ncbi:choice-of-anchor M domain-containing protein [Kribbella sp. HUAS MG21]|jgi:putative ABC transporter-associated repeat protein|uniref:Choice-of-anchor M domain-containing protein n=1 Tax=Kribbella sp. HUAS MG21 TaxID=3160966 RepID=A0AAU7T5H5_9ACTN
MKLLAALLLVLAPVATPAPTDQVVISNGHVDLGPRFVDGTWTLQLRDDTVDPAVWRPVENVVLQATARSQVAVPSDPAYAFLGKAGQKVWVIPQVQQDGVVWPGWNTQDPQVASRVARDVTWSLEGVRGPGTFTLFLNSDFGKPSPVFDSRKPFPQQTGVDVNTHVHGNWTFDAPGTYLLDVAMTAELTDGQHVTDRRTLRIYAGDGDARTAFTAGQATPTNNTTTTAEAPSKLPWIVGCAGLLAVLAVLTIVRRRR